LRSGDTIRSINGEPVTTDILGALIAAAQSSPTIVLVITRRMADLTLTWTLTE
jgi:hypothetical protein